MDDRAARAAQLEAVIAKFPPETKEAEAWRLFTEALGHPPTLQDFLHLVMCRDQAPRETILKQKFAKFTDAASAAAADVREHQVRPAEAFRRHFPESIDRSDFRDAWLKVRAPQLAKAATVQAEQPPTEPETDAAA